MIGYLQVLIVAVVVRLRYVQSDEQNDQARLRETTICDARKLAKLEQIYLRIAAV